jgi:hypothetical protein
MTPGVVFFLGFLFDRLVAVESCDFVVIWGEVVFVLEVASEALGLSLIAVVDGRERIVGMGATSLIAGVSSSASYADSTPDNRRLLRARSELWVDLRPFDCSAASES